MRKRPVRDPGLQYGFRSGLEQKVASELQAAGHASRYEEEKIEYVKPERKAKYNPDFILPNSIIVETKGRFLVEDRQKHILIQAQHPDLDIRFVFSNSRATLSKGSKTSYAAWCDKHGFKFADRSVPTSWLEEPENTLSKAALEAARVKTK